MKRQPRCSLQSPRVLERPSRRNWVLPLGLLAFGATLSAAAQDFLPPQDRAEAAIAARAEVRGAEARVEQTRAEARVLAVEPHEASLSLAPLRRTVRDAPTASGRASYWEWEVELSRAIRLPGKAALDREVGAHALAAAELMRGDAEHQAALDLLGEWMDWLRADRTAALARVRRESIDRERAALLRRVELGDASQRELEQIGAELAAAEAALRQAQAGLEAAGLRLRADFPQLPLPERPPTLPAPELLAEDAAVWSARIIARSHDIRAADELAAQQAAQARRASAERLPDPTIGIRSFAERGGAERGIGLVLELPFGGSRRSAQAHAEAAAAEAMRERAEAVRRDVDRDAQLRVQQARTAQALWEAHEAAREAGAASLSRQRRAWELGEISLAERLQAERLALEAALAESGARADAHEARLRVLIDAHELWHTRDETETHPQH